MTGKDANKILLKSTENLWNMYIGDLTDGDLVVRPVPTANHIAWQMGHLIVAEQMLMKEELPDAKYPDLPAGFADQHNKAASAVEPPRGFSTKAAYVDLFAKTRAATLATVEKLSDADLDRPSRGRMAPLPPTLRAVFV